MLYKPLGKNTGLFLDLVSFSIIDQDNAGQYYPDFAFCHPLFTDQMKIYSDVTVSSGASAASRISWRRTAACIRVTFMYSTSIGSEI